MGYSLSFIPFRKIVPKCVFGKRKNFSNKEVHYLETRSSIKPGLTVLRGPQLHPFNINNGENLPWFYYFHLAICLALGYAYSVSNFWKASPS